MKILSYHISAHSAATAAADLALAILSVFLARALVYSEPRLWQVSTDAGAIAGTLLYAAIVVGSMGSMGLYAARQRYGIEGSLVRTLAGACVAALIITSIAFLLAFEEGRRVWVFALGITLVLLALARIYFHLFLIDKVFKRRVLVYGAGLRAESIARLRRRSDQRGFRIVGFLPAPGDKAQISDQRVIFGAVGCLRAYVLEHKVTEIVIAMDDRRRNLPLAELLECKLAGITITDCLEFLERETGRVKVDLMNPSWLIFSDSFNRRTRRRISLRLLDLGIAGAVLALTWPLLIAIGLLIYLDDGRPILYRQKRVGLDGLPFTLFKFRSMNVNAEAAGSPVWATVDDPRVTRIGHWLRKFRLDELPQLFNVLRGEMSIVGPRPERPEFVCELTRTVPYYRERHSVKPGITGWAQLCYGYGASENDALAKLEFDLYYIKHRSLVLYLMILLQTAEVVLWQKGSR